MAQNVVAGDMGYVMRKSVFRVTNQVLHRLGCATTKDGWRLELYIKKVEGLYNLCSENKDTDQLFIYHLPADLRLWFHIFKMQVFS